MQLVALAWRKGVGGYREAVDTIIHHAGPDRLACCIPQVGLVAHRAVAAPGRHPTFNALGGRQVVAQAEIDRILHRVIDGGGPKHGAVPALGVFVIPDAGNAGARAWRSKRGCGHTAHGVGITHGVAVAVLVLDTQRKPQTGVKFGGQPGRQHGARIPLGGAVFGERLVAGLHTDRRLQTRGLALRDRQRGADGVAWINGRVRPIQGVYALNGLDVDHVPARCIKAPQKAGDQVAIQIDQRPTRLQNAKAAPADVGIAVTDVALAHGGARQGEGHVLRIENILLPQLLGISAGGAAGQVGRELGSRTGDTDGLQLGLGGHTLGEAHRWHQHEGTDQREPPTWRTCLTTIDSHKNS